jgi:hypothetical protein
MKQTITFIILFIGLNTIAQIRFEKGYIIKSNDEKIECLIKNEDWLYNPTNFLYKKDVNAKEINGNLNSIKEFGVNGVSKYKRFKVNIDKSKTDINLLSNTRTYNFVTETLFLKTLVEGKANLYLYNEKSLVKYFYKKENSPIKQLEYKEYLNSTGLLAKNKNYLTQLRLDAACKSIDYKKVDYRRNSLVKYFLAYNNCDGNNISVKNYTESNNKNLFNLRAKIGIGNATINTSNSAYAYKNISSSGANIRAGIEAEYVLSFNNNKWAIYVEPTYQTYKGDIEGSQSGKITYNSIELPLGVKHYMFINNNSKLFLSGALVLDFAMDSKIDFNSNTLNVLEISSSPTSYQLGFGYNFNNKYTIETRYNFGRDITKNYVYWETDYSSFSIILGYSIF